MTKLTKVAARLQKLSMNCQPEILDCLEGN
jgi:hypothetical protein